MSFKPCFQRGVVAGMVRRAEIESLPHTLKASHLCIMNCVSSFVSSDIIDSRTCQILLKENGYLSVFMKTPILLRNMRNLRRKDKPFLKPKLRFVKPIQK